MRPDSLLVANTFLTVDGECNAYGPGVWSYFIRLQGCDVGCAWCDTKHTWSWSKGTEISITALVANARLSEARKVTITGGEPLQQYNGPRQEAFESLIARLGRLSIPISIETGGMHPFQELIGRVNLIVDYKLPEALLPNPKFRHQQPLVESMADLQSDDCIKIVVQNGAELEEARVVFINLRRMGCKANMYVSPAFGTMPPHLLFTLMRTDSRFVEYDIRVNLQTHKYLFENDAREEETPPV